MALRPEEILQIKYGLGVSVTLIGAEPYIGYLAIFDKAIAPYIIDPSTTSSTSTAAVIGGASYALSLAVIPVVAGTTTPAFQVGTTVVVDVGAVQETAQISAISGTSVTVVLANAHLAPFPVVMAGGEAVVRGILARITSIEAQMASIAPVGAGVKKVDEIELFGSMRGKQLDKFGSLLQQREQARDDLGEAVGFPNLRRAKRSGGTKFEVY